MRVDVHYRSRGGQTDEGGTVADFRKGEGCSGIASEARIDHLMIGWRGKCGTQLWKKQRIKVCVERVIERLELYSL